MKIGPGELPGGVTLRRVAPRASSRSRASRYSWRDGPFRSAYPGYWIAADLRGRGLATAAVERVCRIARETVGLHRIEATTLVDNAGSQRVLEKCGFPEGAARRRPTAVTKAA